MSLPIFNVGAAAPFPPIYRILDMKIKSGPRRVRNPREENKRLTNESDHGTKTHHTLNLQC